MFSSTWEDKSNVHCHIINCDTFQGYVTIELRTCNIKIFSLTNQTVEDIRLNEVAKATEVAYIDNHQIPDIIVVDSSAYIHIWEYNPSDNKWQRSSQLLGNIKPPECSLTAHIATYENNVIIIYNAPHNMTQFKFIFINLEYKTKIHLQEYNSPIKIIPPPTSFTLVMNELFITYQRNKLTFNQDSNYESKTYSLHNEITNSIYIPDKDLPYLIFITYDSRIRKSFLTSILTDMSTMLSNSFSFDDSVRNMSYNNKIILTTLDNGKIYEINPLTNNSCEIACECGVNINAFIINNKILYIRNNEPYSVLDSLKNKIDQTLSFHAFQVDKTITQIYSENEDTIIVENSEKNQKIYFKSNIIGYCNKNSRIELPKEKNIKYFNNNNNINLQYIYSSNMTEEGKDEENKRINSILINIKNELKICDFLETIIYSQIIGDYLYCIISNNTISKWKYNNSNKSFILEYSKKLNIDSDNKITYANGNINYLCIYYGSDRILSIYNIDCFDQVNCTAKIKPITTLYMSDYNQIYTGNDTGMVKRFDLKCSLKEI